MVRLFGVLRGCAVAIGAAMLFGCTGNNLPEGQPSFYQDLAGPAAALDAGAAQSMISGYRHNNGLGAVTIDPELMRLANEQATAMAARGTLDHSVGAPLRSASASRVSMPASRSRTSAPAITRWRKRSPAGAIRRRTAPTCSTPM